jgi:carbonic anhydrase
LQEILPIKIFSALWNLCNVAGSKLVVVLGRTKCGALKGGLDAPQIEGLGMDNLNHLIYHFEPHSRSDKRRRKRSSKNEDLLERLNVCNIKSTINDIRHQVLLSEILKKEGKL